MDSSFTFAFKIDFRSTMDLNLNLYLFNAIRYSQLISIDQDLLLLLRWKMFKQLDVLNSIQMDRFMRLEVTQKHSESASIHNCLKLGKQSECHEQNDVHIFNLLPAEKSIQHIKRQYYSNEQNTIKDQYIAWHGHLKVI